MEKQAPVSIYLRMQAVFSATLISDDFLNEVYDICGRLLRVVFSQHVTLVAAAWFTRHEAEHPVKTATSFSSSTSPPTSLTGFPELLVKHRDFHNLNEQM